MKIESLIKGLRDPSGIERKNKIKKIINIALESTNKVEFFLLIKALKYSSNSDPDSGNRSLAYNGLETLKSKADKFKSSAKKNKLKVSIKNFSFAKLIIILFLIVILIFMISFLLNFDLGTRDSKLEIAKELDLKNIFNPLNVEEVKPPEYFKGVNFTFLPHVGMVKNSHIREIILKRVGDQVIDTTEVYFDLRQRVIRRNLDEYTIEYRTKNPISAIPLGNFGYPDPGKTLRKIFSKDGNIKSISGDLKGIVPAMSFMNRYVFPNKTIMVGEEWNADYEMHDIKTEANYRFESILRVRNKKFYYITYKIKLVYDSLDFKTVVRQSLDGEIYISDLDFHPVYSKEISILRFDTPPSSYSLELEITREEIFSDAHFLLDTSQ